MTLDYRDSTADNALGVYANCVTHIGGYGSFLSECVTNPL